ncbi:VWA domain-containing protein [Sulfitobacter sp. NFXS29]|uniref:TadE/TadG family type IV pilus assembly protein n=1 Tax=Sulfitobacter sp. NFXS29 TaxID=2818438 RepID=UPI0032DEFDDC
MRRKVISRMLFDRVKRFSKDEAGGMLVLMLVVFFGITIFGGLAVDLANHERTRTTFQTHLDNAVLAAASLSQDLDPEEVVRSYLTSAGLDPSEVAIDTSEEKIGGILVGRTVEASLPAGLNTYFFRFFDIDTLGMTVTSEATERVEDIEISLVLDVSGSMNERTSDRSRMIKLDLLKNAASDFVETILSDSEEGRVSISIVPYSTKVNAGEELLSQYSVTEEHAYSDCVDFDADDFIQLGLSTSKELQRTGHFLIGNMSAWYPTAGQWVCRFDAGFPITPLSSSVRELQAQIAALTGEGSTSIDIGAKWGLALLDPSAQVPVANLVTSGRIEPEFRGRPHPYDADNSMKVLVLMTDGENREEYRLHPNYTSGPSGVTRTSVGNTDYYTVDSPENSYENDGQYPYPERYFYATHSSSNDRIWSDYRLIDHPNFGDAWRAEEEDLTWPQVWAEMSPYYFGYNLYGIRRRSGAANRAIDFRDYVTNTTSASEKDRRLRQICGVANTAGVVVYSIGMDVDSTNSLNLLKDCASSEAHYFDVQGLEIQTAFDMIAASISMLRLTK